MEGESAEPRVHRGSRPGGNERLHRWEAPPCDGEVERRVALVVNSVQAPQLGVEQRAYDILVACWCYRGGEKYLSLMNILVTVFLPPPGSCIIASIPPPPGCQA